MVRRGGDDSRDVIVSTDLKDRAEALLREWAQAERRWPAHGCEWVNEGLLYRLDTEELADRLELHLKEG